MESKSPSRRLFAAATNGLLLLVVAMAGAPMFTSDAFWQVASGDWLRVHGLADQSDPFSFTATSERWVLHEWLTQVVFSLAHEAAGMYGLRLLTAAMAALIAWLVVRLWRRSFADAGDGGAAAGLFGLAAFVALGTMRIQSRPSLFTIAAILFLVSLWTRRSQWRWRDAAALVAVQLLWTNAHSVALVGPVLYAVFFVGRAVDAFVARRGGLADEAPAPGDLRRHAVTLFLAIAATVGTPAGVHLWEFAWQDKSVVMQYVDDEWAPFRFAFADNAAMPFAAWCAVWLTIAVVGTTAFVVAHVLEREPARLRSPRLPVPSRVLLALALLVGGLLARRFLWLHVLTMLFCAEILWRCAKAGAFARLRAPYQRVQTAVVSALAAGTLAFGAAVLRVDGRPVPAAVLTADYWSRAESPSFALPGVTFLAEAAIEGNAVCHYNSGGILTYRLFPRVRVFVDSRIDLYRRGIFLDYLAVRGGRKDQQHLLDRYGADIYYRHWGLPPPVDAAAWIPVYRGHDGAIWLRRGAERTPQNLERARAWHERHGSAMPADPVGLGRQSAAAPATAPK